MSSKKKAVREAFRAAVFTRDGHRCRGCGFASSPARALDELDAHHVINRDSFPNGGYVAENGISLCAACHAKAEQFHAQGVAAPGFSPDELYALIGSDRVRAVAADARLARR